MQWTEFETAWGVFGMVVREKRLVATILPRDRKSVTAEINKRWPGVEECDDLLPKFRREVENYFSGMRATFSVEVDLSGHTLFRRAVLEACRRIPYGRTASYADLARAVGCPNASRAVGGAMASNPLPLVIPCHRVLRSDGSLGGFSSTLGTGEKELMLKLEGIRWGIPLDGKCLRTTGLRMRRAAT